MERVKEWITLLQLQGFYSRWYYSHWWTQTTNLSGLTLETIKGSSSEAQIYYELDLKEQLEKVTLGLPYPDVLPNDNEPTPYYFIGDDAFGFQDMHECLVDREMADHRLVPGE